MARTAEYVCSYVSEVTHRATVVIDLDEFEEWLGPGGAAHEHLELIKDFLLAGREDVYETLVDNEYGHDAGHDYWGLEVLEVLE